MNFSTLQAILLFVFILLTACEKAKNDTIFNEPDITDQSGITISEIDKSIHNSKVYDCGSNYPNSPIFFIVEKVEEPIDNTYELSFGIEENDDYIGPDYNIDEINWTLISNSSSQHYSGDNVTVSFTNGTPYYDLLINGVIIFDNGSKDICVFRQYNTEHDGAGLGIIEGMQADCHFYIDKKATYTLILP